jgi:tetratricopeptide (TPR) repeat protein
MYYYLGRFPESIDAHQRAVALAPNDHLAWSNLGDAFWISGNAREAREAFLTAERLASSALQVNRNDPLLLMDLAWISATLQKPEQANEFISRARAQAPDDPYVYYIDGLIALRDGDRSSAVSSFVAALDRGYSDVMLAADPQLAELRGDPRFERALQTGKP